jgi:hypothetical protein
MIGRIFEQIRSAYKMMGEKAKYRPAAPSDGMGNITVPTETLNIEKEAANYAQRWRKDENNFTFSIGNSSFSTRRASIFTVEAARMMAIGTLGDRTALKLLRMAVKELDAAIKKEQVRCSQQA